MLSRARSAIAFKKSSSLFKTAIAFGIVSLITASTRLSRSSLVSTLLGTVSTSLLVF